MRYSDERSSGEYDRRSPPECKMRHQGSVRLSRNTTAWTSPGKPDETPTPAPSAFGSRDRCPSSISVDDGCWNRSGDHWTRLSRLTAGETPCLHSRCADAGFTDMYSAAALVPAPDPFSLSRPWGAGNSGRIPAAPADGRGPGFSILRNLCLMTDICPRGNTSTGPFRAGPRRHRSMDWTSADGPVQETRIWGN